jgi:AsmA protein
MRRLLTGLAVLVVILVLIGLIAPFVIPAGVYRGRIIAAVQSATGRELRIDGPMSVKLLPSVAIEANGVALANAPGGTAKDIATLGKLQVGVKLFPLISGDVEVERFVLVDPVIHLEVDKAGHANWDFSTNQAAPPAPAGAQSQAAPKQTNTLQQLHLGEIKLVNGTVDYIDARSNTHQSITKIDVTVHLPSLDERAAVDGSFDWRSKTVKLALALEKPRVLLGTGTGAAKATISSDPVTFSFDGNVTGGEPLKAGGTVALNVPSIRELAAWAGSPITMSGSGLGPFSVKGNLALSGPTATIGDVVLVLDSIKGKGELAVDTSSAKPSVKGRLDVDMLDLNPYAGPGKQGAAAPPPGAPQPAATAPENGWSTQPIDFSALKAANVDFKIGAGGIRYDKIDIGKSAVAINLQNGRLAADLTELTLYQGSGKGRIGIDASGATPALDANLGVNGIQAAPFLTAAIDFNKITGTGDLNFALTSHGASQRQIVGALGGKANFSFHNGSIKGIDLLAMVKNVSDAFLSAASGSSQQTEFADLAGSFNIANGVMRTDDLALKAPALQLSGAGTVDLPQRRLDLRVEPNVALAGKSVAVPVLITGPWSKPSYQPDLKSILSQQLGKGNLLKGLKGAVAPGGSNTGTSNPPKPADVLKGLFGGK